VNPGSRPALRICNGCMRARSLAMRCDADSRLNFSYSKPTEERQSLDI
jgi:hypothetical protein